MTGPAMPHPKRSRVSPRVNRTSLLARTHAAYLWRRSTGRRNRGRNGKVSVVVARFRVEHDVALASLLRFEGGDLGRYNERHDGYIC